MLAALLNAVRADLDRQVGWAREEARRQIRHVAVIGAIAAGALQEGTRSQLLGTLVPIAIAGMIAGRRLRAGPLKKQGTSSAMPWSVGSN